MASRFQVFSTVASADRKWSSGVGPDVRNGEIDWANLVPSCNPSANQAVTSGTDLKYHFRFTAATVEYGLNRLSSQSDGQSESVE